MPPRTSPMPPLAMPGLPVGFTFTWPSGSAISVWNPLRTTMQPVARAASRAASMRCALMSFAVVPRMRASSPGCGVMTRGRRSGFSSSARPAKAFSAEASMTSGSSMSATSWRMRA